MLFVALFPLHLQAYPWPCILVLKRIWGCVMQCSNTGEMDAIHIPKEVIELAQEIYPAMTFVQANGGEGTITMKVKGGRASTVECALRWFRGVIGKEKQER